MERLNSEFLDKVNSKYNNINPQIYNPFNQKNDNDINKRNILRLFIGMLPSNLPKDLFLPGLDELLLNMSDKNKNVAEGSKSDIKTLEDNLYIALSNFVKTLDAYKNPIIRKSHDSFKNRTGYDDKLIQLFGKYETPSYIYKSGVEPIKFDSIKNTGQIMLMGVDNPILSLIFIYNTFRALKPLFENLYSVQNIDDLHKVDDIGKVILASESPILIKDKYINMEYYYPKSEYSYFNKRIKDYSVEEGAIHKFKLENEHPYYMKLNIQSFYPNIYTHNLERASNHDLFREIKDNTKNEDIVNEYLSFLDKYNMKNNEERTKGIIIGPLSSRISSELLSLDIYYQAQYGGKHYSKEPTRLVDRELSKLFNNVHYARYVDNVIIFSDKLSTLEKLRFRLGQFLQQYELKFQESKCKIVKGIYMPKMANFFSIYQNLPFMFKSDNKFKVIDITLYNFITLRNYIKHLIDVNDVSTLKVVFEEFINKGYKIGFESKTLINLFISFIIKVAIICPSVSFNIYEFLAQTIMRTTPKHNYDSEIRKQLDKTLDLVNNRYDNTTLQVWTYYLLNLIFDKYNYMDNKLKLFNKARESSRLYPLIIMCFISKYNSNDFNNMIWSIIYHKYEKDECSMMLTDNEKQRPNIYNSIIFSKWAYPIYKLHALCDMYDNPNKKCSISRIFLGKDKSKNEYHVSRLFDMILVSIKDVLYKNFSLGHS